MPGFWSRVVTEHELCDATRMMLTGIDPYLRLRRSRGRARCDGEADQAIARSLSFFLRATNPKRPSPAAIRA
jgi:hypothetical protein